MSTRWKLMSRSRRAVGGCSVRLCGRESVDDDRPMARGAAETRSWVSRLWTGAPRRYQWEIGDSPCGASDLRTVRHEMFGALDRLPLSGTELNCDDRSEHGGIRDAARGGSLLSGHVEAGGRSRFRSACRRAGEADPRCSRGGEPEAERAAHPRRGYAEVARRDGARWPCG